MNEERVEEEGKGMSEGRLKDEGKRVSEGKGMSGRRDE